MRIPVYPRGANPRIDREILRKSCVYCEDQVARGVADWVDTEDPSKGIVCRETIYFGERAPQVEALTTVNVLALAELPGIRFVPPATAKKQDQSIVRWRLKEAALIAAIAG